MTGTPNELRISMDRTDAYHWAQRQQLLAGGIIFMSFIAIALGYVATGPNRFVLGILALTLWIMGTLDIRAKTTDGYARRLLSPIYNRGRETPYPWDAFDLEVVYEDE